MMRVVIQLKETVAPLEYNCVNVYQQGDLICLYTEDGLIYAFPLQNVWRIITEYGLHGKNIEEKKERWFSKQEDQT